MTNQNIRDELKAVEIDRQKNNVEKLQEDPVAMGLVMVYAQSLKQARGEVKKEADEEEQELMPDKKAS